MTRIRPGESGHGGRTACLRLRPVLIVSGIPQGGWTDQWEIICPACGDDIDLDFATVSPFLQRLRGPYPTEAAGIAALRAHRGQPERSPTPTSSPAPAPMPRPSVLRSGVAVPTVPPGTATPVRAPYGPRRSGAGERL